MSQEPSLAHLLQEVSQAGSLESQGQFTLDLAQASRKLADFGQLRPELWTLLLGQAFHGLRSPWLAITVERDGWLFRAGLPQRALDRKLCQSALSTLGLQSEATPERDLAVALCALACLSESSFRLRRARWSEPGGSWSLLGEAEPAAGLPAEEVQLQLNFAARTAPAFPVSLWRERFLFSQLPITLGSGHSQKPLSQAERLSRYLPERHPWLEYRSDPPVGRGHRLAGSTAVEGDPGQLVSGRRSHLLWREIDPTSQRSVLLFAYPLQGVSTLHPVRQGCLLEPLPLPDAPPGFRIYSEASECPTDLSQLELRQSPERAEMERDALRHLVSALDLIGGAIESRPSFLPKSRSSFLGDIPAGFMAMIGSLVVLIPPSLEALSFGGLMLGLPGFYFYYSRSQRRREFRELCARTQKQLAADARRVRETLQDQSPNAASPDDGS